MLTVDTHFCRNSRLRTPVHSAANGGWDQILELILDEDAEIDPEDKTGVGNDILNAGGNVFHQSQERNKKKNSRITWDSIPTSLSDALEPLSHQSPLGNTSAPMLGNPKS